MTNQLTIVIPCKNEKEVIITCLDKIIDLGYKIIIADSSDDEITTKLLKDYKLKYPKKIKIVSGGLPSVARNNGFKYVKSEYVLFLDSDVFVEDCKLISTCLRKIIGGNYDLLTTKFRTVEKKYDYIYKIFDIIQKWSSKSKPFALGGFMLFRSEKFIELGGFSENVIIAEDYRLSMKINPNKFHITNKFVYTTSRRFENKGIFYMIKLMLSCWINRNNDKFFEKDHNYWK
jgi:glycosyltransferase involved in cell wall biosynthesis